MADPMVTVEDEEADPSELEAVTTVYRSLLSESTEGAIADLETQRSAIEAMLDDASWAKARDIARDEKGLQEELNSAVESVLKSKGAEEAAPLETRLADLFARTEIDGQARQQDLLKVTNAATAVGLKSGTVWLSAGTPAEAPTSNAEPDEMVLYSPWAISATNHPAAHADRVTGAISLDFLEVAVAASEQAVASIGARIPIPAGASHVRAELRVEGDAEVVLGAFAGYASGEVLFNARLLDGHRALEQQQISLVRATAVVGFPFRRAEGLYALVCEAPIPRGIPALYALAELEAWAGGAGAMCAAVGFWFLFHPVRVTFS
jgi:hypothetical protein